MTRFPKKIKLRCILMSKYVEKNLSRNETIVKKAIISKLPLIPTWIGGVLLPSVLVKLTISQLSPYLNGGSTLLFLWILLVPLFIKAIITTISIFNIELAVTDRRVIGKSGIINTSAMDAPLDKIQNCSVSSGLWGKIFGYGTIEIHTAADLYLFTMVKNPDAFKKALMAQIEQAQEDKMKQQAEEMAKAMSSAIQPQ